MRLASATGKSVLACLVWLVALTARPGDCGASIGSPDGTTLDIASARRVLGIPPGGASTNADDVRAAFRRASLRAHPDKAGGSHEQFVRVSRAYEVLRKESSHLGGARRGAGDDGGDGAGGFGSGGGAGRGRSSASAPFDASGDVGTRGQHRGVGGGEWPRARRFHGGRTGGSEHEARKLRFDEYYEAYQAAESARRRRAGEMGGGAGEAVSDEEEAFARFRASWIGDETARRSHDRSRARARAGRHSASASASRQDIDDEQRRWERDFADAEEARARRHFDAMWSESRYAKTPPPGTDGVGGGARVGQRWGATHRDEGGTFARGDPRDASHGGLGGSEGGRLGGRFGGGGSGARKWWENQQSRHDRHASSPKQRYPPRKRREVSGERGNDGVANDDAAWGSRRADAHDPFQRFAPSDAHHADGGGNRHDAWGWMPGDEGHGAEGSGTDWGGGGSKWWERRNVRGRSGQGDSDPNGHTGFSNGGFGGFSDPHGPGVYPRGAPSAGVHLAWLRSHGYGMDGEQDVDDGWREAGFGGGEWHGGDGQHEYAAMDEDESMEDYVYRRAFADSFGVPGHDRTLGDGDDGGGGGPLDGFDRAERVDEASGAALGAGKDARTDHLCAAGVLDYC